MSNENNTSLISALRTYFSTCNLFNLESPFYTDFNSESPSNYSINMLPSSTPEKDVLGNKYYSKNFAITSREYTPTDIERIDNLELCEELQNWIEEQNDIENFPDLGNQINVTEINVTNSGYLYSDNPDSNTGLYQIQLQINYIKYK